MQSYSVEQDENARVLAGELLDRVASQFETAVDRAGLLCSRNGRLDPQSLDAHQWVCYELALASADLLAARTTLSFSSASAVDSSLALAFASEAVGQVLGRLANVFAELELDAREVSALAIGPEVARLRQQAGSAAVLASLGQMVASNDKDLAQVELDESASMARDAFRRFAAEAVKPLAAKIHRHDLTIPESLLEQMREMGVFGLSIPEEYGGSKPPGSDNTLTMIAVTEALSEASLGAAGSLITRPEILTRALMAGGTPEQKKHWLPRIAAGNPLCAISITEPDFGSDVASLSLKGTRTDRGWLLNGAKTWCTFAGKAGVLMVVTRTDPDRSLGHRGLSLLLVEKPSYGGHEFTYEQPDGGTLQGRAIPTIGYRGMHSYDLTFQDFFVSEANVIGGEEGLGKGFYFTMTGMIGGRVQTAARSLGVMRAALSAAIQYAKDRKVFDAPLVDYPLTQVKIAWIAARFAACRHLTYAVARQVDGGGGRMEASLVKPLACRSAELITRQALQIHGGMGYAEESPVSRYFVDARVLSIFEGAEETLALKVVARTLLEDAIARQSRPIPTDRHAADIHVRD
ncbi:acyl-CoA dehydrogenase family protein [Achromobacter aegrifaciens]